MKYMPILPVGMMDVFTNKNAFILPQYWRADGYADFYRSRRWDIVIIDNAMYEMPEMFDFETMIKIAGLLSANRIFLVVPEDHGDPMNTISLAKECIETYPNNGTWDPMCILHGSDKSVASQFESLKNIPNIGFGIAVSLWRAGYSRVKLYETSTMKTHYIHAMGLDSIDELPLLRNAGFNSVDSSLAATAAWNNINLRRHRQIVRTGSPDDPSRVPITHPTASAVMKLEVRKNIELINTLCEG